MNEAILAGGAILGRAAAGCRAAAHDLGDLIRFAVERCGTQTMWNMDRRRAVSAPQESWKRVVDALRKYGGPIPSHSGSQTRSRQRQRRNGCRRFLRQPKHRFDTENLAVLAAVPRFSTPLPTG